MKANLRKKLAALRPKKTTHKAAPAHKPFLVPPRTKSAPSDDSAYKLMLDDLRKSGLNAADAKLLPFEPYSMEASRALNLPRGADAGYKISYRDSRGKLLPQMWRYRFFKTISDGFTAGAELRRYDQPTDTSVEIYLPHGYIDWEEIKTKGIERLILTEGEKKAACATKNGFPTIGLGGVWSFGRGGGDRRLHLALAPFIRKGLPVYICYDSDAKTKPPVIGAENSLARALLDVGAVVHVVRIPPDGEAKVGLDDYIVKHGKEKFEELLKSTPEWDTYRHLNELSAQYIVCRDTAAICEVATRRMYTVEKFLLLEATRNYREMNAAGKMVELNGGKEWLRWPQRGEVEGLTYDPGAPILANGRLNQWSDPGIEACEGDTTPFDELFAHLIPNEKYRNWIMQWSAYPLRFRGERNNVAVMLWSLTQGQGKSLFGETIGLLHGRENYIEIGPKQLTSDFNPWQRYKTFIMGSELCGTTKGDAIELADRLKTMITGTEISINEKYVTEFTIPNRSNYFLTSNHLIALHLTKQARRYFVVRATEGRLPDAFYKRFVEWRENSGLSALLFKLLQVDLTGFNPGANAPQTVDMQEMIAASHSDLQDWISELPEEYPTRFATAKQLWNAYRERSPNTHVTQKQLTDELRAAEFKRANDGGQIRIRDAKGRDTSKRERLWIIREATNGEKKISQMTLEQIGTEWWKGGIR